MLQKRKIIIDTDIGDEIDDALAIYAAMRQNFDIIGITTVFHNTVDRARQAKKLLAEYGHGYEKVPVYAGYGAPLGTEAGNWKHIPHYTPDLDDNRFTPNGLAPEEAVDFIIDACYQYGKELTVIAIGPFTNLAKVIEKDSKALGLVEKVVIMGGAYYKQYADWNVMCDVSAADLMFRTLHNLECLGADVTHQTLAEDRLYETLLHDRGVERGRLYLTELCRLWSRERSREELFLHDPLVIYYLAHKELCNMNSASVVVVTEGYARGLTLNVEAYSKKMMNQEAYASFDDTNKVLVASSVDLAAFHELIYRDFMV